MGRRIALLSFCVLLPACGGDGDGAAAPAAPVYTRQATTACLKQKDFRIATSSKAVGFVAFTSVGGGLRARHGTGKKRTDVIMAFGADVDDAAQTLRMIRRSPELRQSPIFRFRTRRANVAILWAYRPSKKQMQRVYGCLRPVRAPA